MDHYNICKSLSDSTMSKFVTRKLIEVNDFSKGQNFSGQNLRFKSPMLRSELCDYGDAYTIVKGTINLKTKENNEIPRNDVACKNNAPFKPCIKTHF